MADGTDQTPIALSPATYQRHAAAVEYVESQIRTRDPRRGSGRSPWLSPGAWGRLATGNSIGAASGTTLGTGSVKLCDQSGTVYPENETVDVYNAGAAITASGADKIVRLTWTVGVWAVSCPGA